MKNFLKTRGFGLHGQTKARLFGLLVSMSLAATFSSVAQAATPAAGTTIGNQASVTYTDSSSLQQVATSNLVQTTVAQVGSLALTNGNSKTVAAGQTAYMPHTLTNTGNGTDSFTIQATGTAFTKVEIFADADGDGLPDNTTPLCSSSGAPLCTAGFSTSVAGGGTFKYVVALTVSGSAPAGLITPSATTTATAGTPALYLTSTASNTDAVTVTSAAAFQVNKSIAAPAAATGITPLTGVTSWPAAVSSTLPSGSTCLVTLAGANAPALGCVYTTYTLRYQNNGGSPGNIYLKDVIGTGSTSGLTYVPGSAKWSSGNAALTDAAGSETASGIDFQAVSGTIEAVVSSVGPNVSGSISFIVLVNSNAALGTGTTSNAAAYSDTGCASTTVAGCSASSTVNSNSTVITILQSFGVVANTVTGSASTAAVDKIKKIASAAPGTQVSFPNVIWNTGSGTDTFNLSTSALTINGIAVTPTLFAADGATPLRLHVCC
ncbi:hypothetical protein [Rhodoferax sp. GW822-FHT02A01]|uniref:hypothetical protein n=1 Tax=Rhodoferax sp. GW822-FHT02A01 TaxID=3141537 RepID=UPI00315CA3C2